MINFYGYHKDAEDLDLQSVYGEQLRNVGLFYSGKTDKDYSNILHIIVKDPSLAYWYALTIIRGRWIEAEPTIMEDSLRAYGYAKYILKRRWPEAEPNILKNTVHTYQYVTYVVKGRWKEAEPIIKTSTYWPYYRSEMNI